MVDSTRPPLQRSRSIAATPTTTSLKRCSLHHGFQMDLKQAVQLEEQELHKMGLVAPTADDPLPKAVEDDADASDFESSPPYWLYHHQRLVRKAASFSSGHLQVPCSPPVPIPQQRRYSAAAMDSKTSETQHLSQSQCEARLWDEFWNYKLSFESRESFEVRARASSEEVRKFRSESSETVVEDDQVSLDEPEEEEQVHRYGMFEMDDL